MKLQKMSFLMNSLVIISMLTFSCAKKASSPRAVKQTGSKVMDAGVSTPSRLAAQTQKLDYDIVSISWPAEQNGELKIESEIKTPDGRFIPITTIHNNNSNKDSVGVVEDAKNGNKIDIRARCEGDNCAKYLLLATIVRGGYAVHQLAVVSYSSDCLFNLQNTNYTVAAMYTSLDDLAQRNSIRAQNDRETNCPAE